MVIRFMAGMLAYLIPSFIIAYYWHLVFFAETYSQLEIYREDVIIPFGLASMIIQGAIFSGLYAKMYGSDKSRSNCIQFTCLCFLIGVSYTVLPVAAKFPMNSVSDFVIIETFFNATQWIVGGPLIAIAHMWQRR